MKCDIIMAVLDLMVSICKNEFSVATKSTLSNSYRNSISNRKVSLLLQLMYFRINFDLFSALWDVRFWCLSSATEFTKWGQALLLVECSCHLWYQYVNLPILCLELLHYCSSSLSIWRMRRRCVCNVVGTCLYSADIEIDTDKCILIALE